MSGDQKSAGGAGDRGDGDVDRALEESEEGAAGHGQDGARNEGHGEEDVGEHEDGAAIRASHVGKLPNGTETDGGACARENKPQAGPPY